MRKKLGDRDDDFGSAEPPAWDWITLVVAVAIAMYLVVLTKPLWMPFLR